MRTLEIVHRTVYTYSSPVKLSDYRLMFRPRDSHDLRLLDTKLVIEPAAQVRWIHDPFGNSIAIDSFEGETDRFELLSTIKLEPTPRRQIHRPSRSMRAGCHSTISPRRRPTWRATSSGTILIQTRQSPTGHGYSSRRLTASTTPPTPRRAGAHVSGDKG